MTSRNSEGQNHTISNKKLIHASWFQHLCYTSKWGIHLSPVDIPHYSHSDALLAAGLGTGPSRGTWAPPANMLPFAGSTSSLCAWADKLQKGPVSHLSD